MVCMMIVPETLKETANTWALQIDPDGGDQSFSTPLRPIGSPEITHWYCGPNLIDQSVIDTIRSLVGSPLFLGGIYRECTPENVREEFSQWIAQLGLEEVPA